MNIGLALSGGGIRAATFHLGVFMRFAQDGLLEKIGRLSTVSGGSLVTALIFTRGEIKWPSSSHFETYTYPTIRELILSTDLFSITAILHEPKQWVLVPSRRAQLIANLLQHRWGVFGNLKDLPDEPDWLINATSIESGKNWRFSKNFMGDWKFGYHFDPPFSISEAVAASAAVPYVIGGLKFVLPSEGWYQTNPATSEPVGRKQPPEQCIHLWDGGAYENLGIEPLYKPDRKMIKCTDLIVSDASGHIPTVGDRREKFAILKGNLSTPRLFDIASDQIRSLRSRMFVEALTSNKAKGALLRMGNSAREISLKEENLPESDWYKTYQSDEDVSRALCYPTSLSAMSENDFDLVARHGYECADATLNTYCPDLVSERIPWKW